MCSFLQQDILVAALTAFFDESLSNKRERPLIYSVAGWISTVDKWTEFGKEWKAALGEFGLESFHMNRYENRFEPYDTWSDDERKSRLHRLHQIIKDYRMYGCAFAYEYEFWKIKEQMYPSDSKDPFGPLALACMDALSAWRDRQEFRDDKIEYIFAFRDGQGRDLDTYWKLFRKRQHDDSFFRPSGQWLHQYAKDSPPLQAADILAYEFMKHCAKRRRQSWSNLELTESNCRAVYFARENLITRDDD